MSDTSKNASPFSHIEQVRAMRLAYTGQAVGVIMTRLIIGSSLGLLFISKMGGTDFQLLLLPAIFSLSTLLQIPISLRVHPSNGKRLMLRSWVVAGAILGVVAILPSFLGSNTTSAWIILALISLSMAIQQVGNTFWFPLLRGVVPREMVGRFFGTLRAVWSFSVFISIMLIGWFLGPAPDVWKFQLVLACTIILFLSRNIFVAKIPENHERIATDSDFQNWRTHIREFLARRDVLFFCLYITLMLFCASILAQPLVLYMKLLGYSTKTNLIINGFVMLGMTLTLLLSGHLVDRFGTKRVFLAAHISLCITCFSVIVFSKQDANIAKVLLPISMIVYGATMAASGLATAAQLFHFAPDRGQAFFLSLSRILMMAGAFLSPLIVGFLLRVIDDPLAWELQIFSIRLDMFQALFAAAGILMIVLIAVLHFVVDVRPKKHTS